jgi:hypothetical protein
MSPNNRADDDRIYRFTPVTTSHNGKFSKGSARLLLGSTSAWAVRGSSEAHSSPREGLVVSSAHLEVRTALTDEGLLLGKMAFGSLAHVRPGWRFQFARGFGHAERPPHYGFDGNANAAHVTWLLLHRDGPSRRCRPSAQMAVLRRRRFERPEALRVGREHRVRGQQWHGRDVQKGATRPKQDPRLLRYRRCGAPGHVAAANV